MGRNLGLKIVLILLVVLGGLTFALMNQGLRPNLGPIGVKYFDRGPLYPAVLKSVLSEVKIRSDLVMKGLVSVESGTGDGFNIKIDTGGIEKLIKSGDYYIDPSHLLQPGPIPGDSAQTNPVYRYAQRITQGWGFMDDFRFTAHSVDVTFPAGIDLGTGTTHNLYNTHLVLPNGEWVESGFGWVNWTSSPVIYTYQSYTDGWDFTAIPDGVQRDIFLKIEVNANLVAEMSVSDPYSGKSIVTRQEVTGQKNRVDFTQEQHSYGSTWIVTPKVRFHGNKIKQAGNDEWVDWNNNTLNTWMYDSPLRIEQGMENGQSWTETWSTK